MPIQIGTSGWHYRHWLGPFYPTGTKPASYLKLYADLFKTVELNNSFYRLPETKTLAAWRETVPEDFRFAVKASRFITHNKKLKDDGGSFGLFFERIKELKDDGGSFGLFFERIKALGDRLGPILFQLPPGWKYNGERLEEFLSMLPEGPGYVFEFRNPDWMREEAFARLRKHGAGFCIHDMHGSAAPEITTSDLVYVRFHGPEGKYRGSYPSRALESWAEKMREWSRAGKRVFAYFNNDMEGFAPRNARSLMKLISGEKG